MNIEHREASKADQRKFMNYVSALCNLVDQQSVINPYKESSSDLVILDTGEIMDEEIVRSLQNAYQIGQEAYKQFTSERIVNCSKAISDVIPRVGLYTFGNRPPVDLKKGYNKLKIAKSNTTLVTKMFFSLQSRPDADMQDFFRHENQCEPPSISDEGNLYSGTKSELIDCLPKPGYTNLAAKEATVIVFDMAAVMHFVIPQRAKLFGHSNAALSISGESDHIQHD